MHLAPRAVTWGRSYTETSVEGQTIVLVLSTVYMYVYVLIMEN